MEWLKGQSIERQLTTSSPAAAASASSAASAQSRAEIADALRRQGKCVPASLSAAPLSAAAARKGPIHFRIVDAKT